MLVVPSFAGACPIPFRSIGPVKVAKVDVREPVVRLSSRAAWKLDDSWTSTTPELNQVVIARRGPRYEGVTFASQRGLSIDATEPSDRGWKYSSDDDPATPPCDISGQGEWQRPVIHVREDRRSVRIAAVAQHTTGDRTGCILGGEDAEWGCPTLTRSIVHLKNPIGGRKLIFEVFRGDDSADAAP
ncbi:MAG: hypothetical protein JWM86_1231 [Thermoleophilia bacterium]|nr:hypothetical protein [Thermoleophilia bacterium]